MLRAWFHPSYVRYLNWADSIVADSAATFEKCRSAGMDDGKLSIIYESVDLKRYSSATLKDRMSFRAEFGLDDSTLAIGLVGQVLQYKGHEEFIRAAAIVARHSSATRFFVVGDDTLSDDKQFLPRLHHLVEQEGLHEKVSFIGFRSDIPQVLAGLDIVVAPSHTEALGRVIIEALASRRPVVASRVGGIPEVVEDGITGFLVPPKSHLILANRLVTLCQNPSLRAAMGQQGPESVRRFDAYQHVQHFQNLYFDILHARRTSSWRAIPRPLVR
jgi:glycosyltransferase involved in cell wall biosynthesis